MEKPTCIVIGTGGSITIGVDGDVLETDIKSAEHSDLYSSIVKFDLAEYRRHYGKTDTQYDILDLGYWCSDGKYEPAEEDFRNSVCNRTSF